ncbi:MAG TPA: hypothetical protein VLM79_06470 [Kofleriaceae bacterium]|nr:hypothetical protein [Kofleriaceae bacterium]
MKNALLLLAALSLACAPSATAAPDKPAAPARAADACRPEGKVTFEIDHRVDPGAKLPTSIAKVFANGAWTRDETDADGKALPQRIGCLSTADAKQLDTALAGATWKVTKAQFHCMAMTPQFTVYQVRGKTVFTDRLCSGESLDEKSRAKLDAAIALVEQAQKAP